VNSNQDTLIIDGVCVVRQIASGYHGQASENKDKSQGQRLGCLVLCIRESNVPSSLVNRVICTRTASATTSGRSS
jgi:hypothetical protein